MDQYFLVDWIGLKNVFGISQIEDNLAKYNNWIFKKKYFLEIPAALDFVPRISWSLCKTFPVTCEPFTPIQTICEIFGQMESAPWNILEMWAGY